MTKREFMLWSLVVIAAVMITMTWRGLSGQAMHITVKLDTPLPKGQTVHITGNVEALGSWNGEGQAFVQTDDYTWEWAGVMPDSSITYKITLGDWAQEAWIRGERISRDFAAYHGIDTTIHVEGFGQAKKANLGQVTGHLQVLASPASARTDEGLQIPSRRMWWWRRSAERPVGKVDLLLMTDGQNAFDPTTSSMGADWAVDEALDSLISGGYIPETVALGIECADDGRRRQAEYGHGPIGKVTMAYFCDQILPGLRDSLDIDRVFFAGSSMGGNMAFMLMAWHPESLDGAIGMSPAVYVKTDSGLEVDALRAWHDAGNPWPEAKPFYYDNGGVGLEAQLQPGIDQLKRTLNRVADSTYLNWVRDPFAIHNELAWRERFPAAYVWMSNTAR